MMHFKKAKKKGNKARNQNYHAKLRALQRFGVALNNDDLGRMAEVYRHDPSTTILYKQSNTRIKAIITYRGEAYPIIYDKTRHQLATVLTPDYLNKREREVYDKYKARLVKEESR